MFSSTDLKKKGKFYWNDKKRNCNIYIKSLAKVINLKCEIKKEYFLKDFASVETLAYRQRQGRS